MLYQVATRVPNLSSFFLSDGSALLTSSVTLWCLPGSISRLFRKSCG